MHNCKSEMISTAFAYFYCHHSFTWPSVSQERVYRNAQCTLKIREVWCLYVSQYVYICYTYITFVYVYYIGMCSIYKHVHKHVCDECTFHEHTCVRTVQNLCVCVCESLPALLSEIRVQVWQDCAQPVHHLLFKQIQGITAPAWWIMLLQVPWELKI